MKIIDFGVSVKLNKISNKCEGIQGQWNYRAPEMLDQQEYDQAVDIWALGIIMFMCVAGRHPFIAPFSDTLDNIRNQAIDFKEECW